MNPSIKRAFTTISTLAAGTLVAVALACSPANPPEQPAPATHTPTAAAAATAAPTATTAPTEPASVAEARSPTEVPAEPDPTIEQVVMPTPLPTSNKPLPPTITPVPTPTTHVPPPTPAEWYPQNIALTINLAYSHRIERPWSYFEETWGLHEFGRADHDNDCQDSRQELLIERSLAPVTFTNPQEQCEVATGLWEDDFTKDRWDDPNFFVVVPAVPPENVYQYANSWSHEVISEYTDVRHPQKQPKSYFRKDFPGVYNHKPGLHLRLVSTSTAADRAGRGPDEWKPENRQHWCEYAFGWIDTKYMWKIDTPQAEADALKEMLDTCQATRGFTPDLRVLE